MTFEEWQGKHGPNGGAYDIEMQRAGWDGRKQQVEDLSALAARLARALRKAAPEHNLPALAMDYLQRKGLCGSPLRDAPNALAQADAACGVSPGAMGSASDCEDRKRHEHDKQRN